MAQEALGIWPDMVEASKVSCIPVFSATGNHDSKQQVLAMLAWHKRLLELHHLQHTLAQQPMLIRSIQSVMVLMQ